MARKPTAQDRAIMETLARLRAVLAELEHNLATPEPLIVVQGSVKQPTASRGKLTAVRRAGS